MYITKTQDVTQFTAKSHIHTTPHTESPGFARTNTHAHPDAPLLPERTYPSASPPVSAPPKRPPPKAPLLRVGPIFWTRWKAQTPSSSCTYKKPSVAEQANPVAVSSHSTCGTVELAHGHAWTRGGGGGRCSERALSRNSPIVGLRSRLTSSKTCGKQTEHVGACSPSRAPGRLRPHTLLSTCPRCLKLHASAVDDLDGAVAAARNALARVRGLYGGDVLQVLVEDLHAHSRSTPTVSNRTVTAPARHPHPRLR